MIGGSSSSSVNVSLITDISDTTCEDVREAVDEPHDDLIEDEFGDEARARSSSSSKPESLPILVLKTVTFLLASIYRGFLTRMRSHPHLMNPPRLGGNPRRGLARIVLVSHVCLSGFFK